MFCKAGRADLVYHYHYALASQLNVLLEQRSISYSGRLNWNTNSACMEFQAQGLRSEIRSDYHPVTDVSTMIYILVYDKTVFLIKTNGTL